MIKRYTREKMGYIWSEKNKFQKWLDVEIAVCKAWNKLGKISDDALKEIIEKTHIDDQTVEKIHELDKIYNHDVLAFVTAVAQQVGENGRYIHLGLTSSDVIDTALALIMREALDLLIESVDELLEILKENAFRYKDTVMMGRTHGVHAEPMVFGLKFALWYEEFKRNKKRLQNAKETVSVGTISGAVGTYSNIPPQLEELTLAELGLKPEPVANQVIQRDRHAEFMTAMAITASSLEKIAVEIRHLQRTEVLEAQEPFKKGQRGSSAMPHKRNPITCERITGLARVIRANAIPAMEDIALWHERDISHSSVERVIMPDSAIALDYILHLTKNVLKELVVYPENMRKNMDKSKGLYFSSKVLVALVEKGLSRDEAYDIVQRNAMKAWDTEGLMFKDALLQDPDVTSRLTKEEIDKIFNVGEFLKNIDYIYKRVFENS
ncbi:adenylosuccinate lyase [Sulfurihydrogenibium azorense Az-Fu1]|jgi:adenylosuccinate lyase|uniref:Adenylosuccinate lyase n=1 Tax=Sulfurihydrogenibium azorense (strain DSM 15241 / OCM 825 / Az-Fu1) TaxID=204536 RepID=C1DWP0_SULAA|nr:adenylosuccinate lyase [Sulfurihydrogenibium azorense]ACN99577.1 adenylosuccinate lyase [Sulfurihydrogenibium azorense Az-Fu1]